VPFDLTRPQLWPEYVPLGARHFVRAFSAWEEDKAGRLADGGYAVTVVDGDPATKLDAAAIRDGFADGTWIPYLAIGYELTKQGSSDKITGTMMPMVASDGPHYGDNVKLAGPGRYKLKLSVAPPGTGAHSHFGRHVDKETGVGAWFKPFTVEYDFAFAGVGKKGGY